MNNLTDEELEKKMERDAALARLGIYLPMFLNGLEILVDDLWYLQETRDALRKWLIEYQTLGIFDPANFESRSKEASLKLSLLDGIINILKVRNEQKEFFEKERQRTEIMKPLQDFFNMGGAR